MVHSAARPMYVFLCFDVEDLVHPASDDAPRDIACVLGNIGVVASMCIVGEKARLWEQRGRGDVVASVSLHDVSLHTNRHSMHPTVAEYLEDKGWSEGVEEATRREGPGVRDLARILGSFPSSWGTSGSSWGPQIPAATRRMGIPSNIYSHVTSERSGAWWFGGQLCYPNGVGLRGGEDALCSDDTFEVQLPQLLHELEGLKRSGAACVLLFGGHPTRFMYRQFWDALNFAGGRDTAPQDYRFAPRRADNAYTAGIRNLRRMALAVRDLPGARLTSVRALNGRFSPESGPVALGGLDRLAERVGAGGAIPVDDPVASPAQTLDLLCRSSRSLARGENAPSHLLSRSVLGPVQRSRSLRKNVGVDAAQADRICRSVIEAIDATGHLPSQIAVKGSSVGPGPLLVGLARRYRELRSKRTDCDLTLLPGPEVPSIAAKLAEEQIYRTLPGWPPHRPDLSLEGLAEHLILQTWSLKPARLA